MPSPDQFREESVEECEQQGRNMMAVNIRISVDNNFPVSQPRIIECLAASRPDALNQIVELAVGLESFSRGLLNVENLPS